MHPPILESGSYNLIRARHGYMLYNRNDIGIGRFIESYGEFFEAEIDVLRQLCGPGQIACDVGANIGTHTLALAEIVGPQGVVFAFEPQRLVHQLLCANVALNTLSNVVTVHAAVGAESGEVMLGDPDPKLAVNVGALSLAQLSGPLRTAVVTLDAFLNVPHLRLIKIDVEGMELEVLRGAAATLAKHRPILYIENNRPENSQALIEFIREQKYRLYWHVPSYFNPSNYFGNQQQICAHALVDQGGEYLVSEGIEINMLCLPAEAVVQVTGYREITDVREHPLKREYKDLLAAGPA